jgi:hypothetical protein
VVVHTCKVVDHRAALDPTRWVVMDHICVAAILPKVTQESPGAVTAILITIVTTDVLPKEATTMTTMDMGIACSAMVSGSGSVGRITTLAIAGGC